MTAIQRMYARRRRLQQQAEQVAPKSSNKAIRALLALEGKTPSADPRGSFSDYGVDSQNHVNTSDKGVR